MLYFNNAHLIATSREMAIQRKPISFIGMPFLYKTNKWTGNGKLYKI
jgi:hypothetical protein